MDIVNSVQDCLFFVPIQLT